MTGEIGNRRNSGYREDPLTQPGMTVDEQGARWIRRHLASAVGVVSTSVAEGYRATTATGSVCVSLVPALFLVSIDSESQMDQWLRASGVFVLNILPWSEQFAADQFAGYTPLASPTLHNIDHHVGQTGAPILARSIAWVECRIVDQLVTGDHTCFVGEAVSMGSGSGDPDDPLIYYLSRYRGLR